MLIWWLLAAMLLTLAWVLLTLTRDDGTVPEAEKRFNEVLEADEGSAWLQQRRVSGMARVTRRFRRLLESLPGSDMQEIELLIRQAALMDDARRSRVYTSLWLAPVLLAALAMVIGSAKGWPLFHSAFAGLTVGYIAPRSILRNLAERRRLAIRDEMPVALNLMRLLFDAGLSLEHTLKAISEQGRQVTPNLADEFAWVLQRIQHDQPSRQGRQDVGQAQHRDDAVHVPRAAAVPGRPRLPRAHQRLQEDVMSNTSRNQACILVLAIALSGCALPAHTPAGAQADSSCGTELSPTDNTRLAGIEQLLREGKPYAALAQLDALAAQGKRPPQLDLARADALRRIDRLEQAESLYRGSLNGCLQGRAWHGLGLQQAQRGQQANRIASLEQARNPQPTDAPGP